MGQAQRLKDAALSAPKPELPPPLEIDPKVFEGKPRISKLAEIEWVNDNLDTKVSIEDAPSAGAWSLLCHVRQHPMNRKEFYKDFVTKLIPPRNKLDQDGRHEDDGREQLAVLAAVEKELILEGRCPTCGRETT